MLHLNSVNGSPRSGQLSRSLGDEDTFLALGDAQGLRVEEDSDTSQDFQVVRARSPLFDRAQVFVASYEEHISTLKEKLEGAEQRNKNLERQVIESREQSGFLKEALNRLETLTRKLADLQVELASEKKQNRAQNRRIIWLETENRAMKEDLEKTKVLFPKLEKAPSSSIDKTSSESYEASSELYEESPEDVAKRKEDKQRLLRLLAETDCYE